MSHPESGRPARNRLGGETSPYLLQHAANPVDWYPWGEEAFERARREDRPVLLSVGYSACHWCHVMERESFEDEETARLMNEHFVSVKVDREERPDVDALYMAAVQQMTGHGGWPMTVFLTPEGVPFYGGTYFPPRPRPGMPSFRQVLAALADAYRERRDEVLRSADQAREVLQRAMAMRAPTTPLDSSVVDGAAVRILGGYDEANGGFGRAPKFPQPMVLEFLLRTAHRTGDERALAAVEGTLEAMARGGIFDHLGGGFHRYSVDARWLVPHFEKMLYDNALLARVYLHAHLATGRADFRRTAETVLDYVLREMTSPEGAFYSTEDADSEGEEGRFYLWTVAEVDELLGPVDGPLFRRYYDVTTAGNFAGDGHEGRAAPAGASILHAPRDVASVAAEAGVDAARLETVLERGRRVLLDARAARVRPARDEKVLTAWNAMTVRTLAEAGAALSREDYLAAARRCAGYLLRVHRPDGVLLRTSRDGRARIGAFLEDHALLADALVSLYEADFDPGWIEEARAVAGLMLERHWSEPEAMFHDTAADGEALVVRPRDVNDGATPSGVSSAVTVLLRLAALTGEDAYERIAVREMENLAGLLPEIPHGFGEMLCAVDAYVRGTREVAVVGRPEASDTLALLRVLRERYLPATVLALRDPGADDRAARAVPLLRDREMVDGRAAAYVCRRFTCRRPVTEPGALEAELAGA